MRILISIEHPAWAHQFKQVIWELEKRGHIVKVVAINKDRDLELLDIFNIKYDIISNTSGKTIIDKGIIFLKTTIKIYQISKRFKPDIYIGRASPMMAINSFLFKKRHIVFADTEHATSCIFFAKLFSDIIFTPNCYKKNLGKKQVRINAYKELFYLHPNCFTPDPAVLSELNLSPADKFIIVRFVAWDAHHDIGHHGIQDMTALVQELERYGQVFITSEGRLDGGLAKYQIKVSPEKMHDLMYYASLYVGDSPTMATESAILGVPAVLVSSWAYKAGNMEELRDKYGLMFPFSNQDSAIKKAIYLLKNDLDKLYWFKKRENLLKDKIDVTAFMVEFIENYPESSKEMLK